MMVSICFVSIFFESFPKKIHYRDQKFNFGKQQKILKEQKKQAEKA